MSGREERLYEVLAGLYGEGSFHVVAAGAGVDLTRVPMEGSALVRWEAFVREAKAAGRLSALVLHAARDYERAAPRLDRAYNLELGERTAYDAWQTLLGRSDQRRAVSDAIDWNNRGPVIALLLLGGQAQGHPHFGAWVRTLRDDRRPTSSLVWPDDADPARCAHRAVQRLYDACALKGLCPPPPDDPAEWIAWMPPFTESALRAWVIRDEPDAQTLVVVKHVMPKVKVTDALAVACYLDLAWRPLAATIRRRGQAGLRVVALFEVVRDDEAIVAAFRELPQRAPMGVDVPTLPLLEPLAPGEIADWLHHHVAPRRNRVARGDRDIPAELARAAHAQTDGVYELVLDYFSPP